MSIKRSAQTKAPPVPSKRQRKMLTIAQNVRLLDMLKEGIIYVAVGRHYGIKGSSARYIKEEKYTSFEL